MSDMNEMIRLDRITKIYNPGDVTEICLFSDFSLSVKRGEFVSVVGSNGSGKTSFLNIICGSVPVDAGRILIDGVDVTGVPEHRRYARIGRVWQNPATGTCSELTIQRLPTAVRRRESPQRQMKNTAQNAAASGLGAEFPPRALIFTASSSHHCTWGLRISCRKRRVRCREVSVRRWRWSCPP